MSCCSQKKPRKIAHIVKRASNKISYSETYSRMQAAGMLISSKWQPDWKGLNNTTVLKMPFSEGGLVLTIVLQFQTLHENMLGGHLHHGHLLE